jgi:hypothetical protein
MLPLDQREEGLIRDCILDYEPAAEDEGYSCNFLDLDIPLTLHDLTKFEDEQFKSSSAYRQESNTPRDQVKPSNPEETTCTQNEDSSMCSSQDVEDKKLYIIIYISQKSDRGNGNGAIST